LLTKTAAFIAPIDVPAMISKSGESDSSFVFSDSSFSTRVVITPTSYAP